MDDEISSGEGPKAPSNENRVRRRRIRKLSGPAAAALGELAFVLYAVSSTPVHGDQRWDMLNKLVLKWRSQFL